MIRCVSFTASTIEINPKSDNLMEVELEVSGSEFNSMLGYFDEQDAVCYFGATNLLQHMDVEKIREFLSDIGVKSEWEEFDAKDNVQ